MERDDVNKKHGRKKTPKQARKTTTEELS